MQRAGLFVLLLGGSAVALVLVTVWYLSTYQGGYGSMTGMMGQMMGSQYSRGAIAPMPSYVWVPIATLFVLVMGGIVGSVYYLAYPQIRTLASQEKATASVSSKAFEPKENWETVLRTSNPEERKVLEVLAAHEGIYLQKFIVKESGLSKLKTHRIVSRFSGRGIVTAVKSGNTNEISLAQWLKDGLQKGGQPA